MGLFPLLFLLAVAHSTMPRRNARFCPPLEAAGMDLDAGTLSLVSTTALLFAAGGVLVRGSNYAKLQYATASLVAGIPPRCASC
jgi:hypothetical protein